MVDVPNKLSLREAEVPRDETFHMEKIPTHGRTI